MPGQEAKFLAPLDVRDHPRYWQSHGAKLERAGSSEPLRDLPRFQVAGLDDMFGKWGLALAGKARGEDAGGWFDNEVGADTDAKSISHEHTYNEDTANVEQIESTLMRLSEMVGRRLREAGLARAHHPTQAALQRFHHHHPRPYCPLPTPTRHRNLRANTCAFCFARTEINSASKPLLEP